MKIALSKKSKLFKAKKSRHKKAYLRALIYSFVFTLLASYAPLSHTHQQPRLSIIIVVDQLSYYALQKYKKFFRGGFVHLMHRGVNYTNAYHPHAIPETAAGHAALSTGCYPKDHGIVSNSWFNSKGQKITACYDSPEKSAVFSPTGLYDYGASSEQLKVDTITDQFMLQSLTSKPHHAYALSLKDYAVVQMAGKLGKAIWLDPQTGNFTSSKAYFDALPSWISEFNREHSLRHLDHIFWAQAKPATSNGYIFAENQSLEATEFSHGLVNTEIPLDWEDKSEEPLHLFIKTPQANQRLLDLAKSCIDQHVNKKNKDHLLLWISLSSLDKAGHAFGPDSKETIDLIYHLDKQLQRFIRYAQKAVGKHETLFVLTADHGISPIPATVAQKGYPAIKYFAKDLIKKLNKQLKKAGHGTYSSLSHPAHNGPDTSKQKRSFFIRHISNNQIYFDNALFSALSATQQNELLATTKQLLLENPGVKRVWTYQELAHGCFDKCDLAYRYKNQLYPDRSGHITIQMDPYCEISEWEKGADHSAPYDYNTHVPLILYQHGSVELKKIDQRVSTLQLAPTLADILCIPKPSTSTASHLPGLHGRMPILLF